MNAKEFSNALGNIGEGYVDEAIAYTPKRKKNAWVKWVSVAACLCLIVMGGIFADLFRSPDTPDNENSVLSYFIITAHAANGESMELSVADSCFNSAPAKEGNGFGVDMPIFHFSVRPTDLKNNEAIYDRFDISISYNGSPVKAKDEHIHVAYLISTTNTNEPWSYSITGWFTEPTDVVVIITDKESGEVVETITVNVKYSADKQEYELKVTNLNTKFSEQKEAVDAHNYLMSILMGKNGIDYPEWFGGCYIEENKLYIKLVSPSDEEMKKISDALAHFGDVVVYKNAERSMAELQEYADKTAKELMDNGYAVTLWYVDSITGNVVIAVLEKDVQAATAWADNSMKNENDPLIVIEAGEYTVLDTQTVEFCADPFLQNIALSWMYSINVKIDNGEIYLNDILYDRISYIDNIDPDFSQLSPGPYVNANITEVLDKISSQKGCYLLETASESKYGQRIIMYIIDDTYYLIRFFDNGSIMRVHYGSVK